MNNRALFFPQTPEWTKVVEWSNEDNCYVGSILGPLGPCCHGDTESDVYRELCEIENEWRGHLGMPLAAFHRRRDVLVGRGDVD